MSTLVIAAIGGVISVVVLIVGACAAALFLKYTEDKTNKNPPSNDELLNKLVSPPSRFNFYPSKIDPRSHCFWQWIFR